MKQPNTVAKYNQLMGGVDLVGCFISYIASLSERKSGQSACSLLDMACCKRWIRYKKKLCEYCLTPKQQIGRVHDEHAVALIQAETQGPKRSKAHEANSDDEEARPSATQRCKIIPLPLDMHDWAFHWSTRNRNRTTDAEIQAAAFNQG